MTNEVVKDKLRCLEKTHHSWNQDLHSRSIELESVMEQLKAMKGEGDLTDPESSLKNKESELRAHIRFLSRMVPGMRRQISQIRTQQAGLDQHRKKWLREVDCAKEISA